MQGRIMTATQSRYARMHKDSHTKPLHDATAQMAVNAQMQRHKWLSMHKWLTTCTGALPQSKDACSQPHKATMQGRIMTATQSRYARMHKDSHTKPLHDATAQMAVNAQMQRHKQLTLQRCKTNRASNAKHPFSKIYRFFDCL